MRNFYLDTSALLKGYITEDGSEWVRFLLSESSFSFFTSAITTVEAACSFARRKREGFLSEEDHKKVWRSFEYDIKTKFYLIRVDRRSLRAAEYLGQVRPLRAYDALQLGSAMRMNSQLEQRNMSLSFVTADIKLARIAAEARLNTINPQDESVA